MPGKMVGGLRKRMVPKHFRMGTILPPDYRFGKMAECPSQISTRLPKQHPTWVKTSRQQRAQQEGWKSEGVPQECGQKEPLSSTAGVRCVTQITRENAPKSSFSLTPCPRPGNLNIL